MVIISTIGIISSQAPKHLVCMGKVQRSNGWAVAMPVDSRLRYDPSTLKRALSKEQRVLNYLVWPLL